MIIRILLFFILWISPCNLIVAAQIECHTDSNAVVTNAFWDNWYAHIGVDMNLMFPHSHSVKDVFPNGKSFGVNVAAGKWFTPEFGGRFKVVWNNGILPNNDIGFVSSERSE